MKKSLPTGMAPHKNILELSDNLFESMEWTGSRMSPDKPQIQVIDEVKEEGEDDITERK
jgi:hypothetical protein